MNHRPASSPPERRFPAPLPGPSQEDHLFAQPFFRGRGQPRTKKMDTDDLMARGCRDFRQQPAGAYHHPEMGRPIAHNHIRERKT